ncbi:hypothetical protein N3K66_005829 [Trichothecium roseum]|uniref:Uncharacterized protein n=1 Tax=Trichothecium roseum TaxID=47278 RepID=A0ACC0UYZ8_9HYPO|nr:hypothetical protein N3K66_005829 [Trichothecium roseum]
MRGTLNPSQRNTLEDGHEYDVYVDMQWVEAGVDENDYADNPWMYPQDIVDAFLGLRISKRKQFYDALADNDRSKLDRELQHIQEARKMFSEDDTKKHLMGELRQSREQWKNGVQKTLIAEKIYGLTTPRRETKAAEILRTQALQYPINSLQSIKLNKSATAVNYRDQGIRKRICTAIAHNQWNSQCDARETPSDEGARQASNGESAVGGADHHGDTTASRLAHCGFKAGVIYFRRNRNGSNWIGETVSNDILSDGEFPHQKMSVDDILGPETNNPLRIGCHEDNIRWFHFPTNNMGWIEKALRNYAMGSMSADGDNVSQTHNLLARKHWRGQMHGTWPEAESERAARSRPREHDACLHGPVHARHMRSRCSLIPRDSVDSQHGYPRMLAGHCSSSTDSVNSLAGKNISLFLPYLHWETSTRQTKMINIVNESERPKAKPKHGGLKAKPKSAEVKQFHDIVKTVMRKRKMDDSAPRASISNNRASVPLRFLLGRYLLKVAQVADQMDYAADERLLRSDINQDPPLHMRRTLDQYYFLTLDTSERDKDQVVYRETKTSRGYYGKPRVVMVDQLWMWILDDRTIITSFPKRWGRNKPDSSGVHKSLRDRLEAMHTRGEGIQSIHHLAAMIIDQCSRVFFDRTRALDERPEVMDLFSSAIGYATQHASNAYDNFWRYTHLYSMGNLPDNYSRYLDINPEGVILRECQDIAEELKIMLRVYAEQAAVVKEYRRYLGRLNGELKDGRKVDAPLMQRLIETLESRGRDEGGSGETRQDQSSSQMQRGQPWLNDTIGRVDFLLEAVESRKGELLDLQESALRTQSQLESLLQLKQQQASIIEAKAALKRQEESIRQGRAIMAFTILPLGFFAAFFGMNNNDINDAQWMSLYQQIGYMFGLSTLVIALSVGLAFSDWARALAVLLIRVPLVFSLEVTGLRRLWNSTALSHQSLEKRNRKALRRVSGLKRGREEKRKKAVIRSESIGRGLSRQGIGNPKTSSSLSS